LAFQFLAVNSQSSCNAWLQRPTDNFFLQIESTIKSKEDLLYKNSINDGQYQSSSSSGKIGF